jgi:hypothetical protein
VQGELREGLRQLHIPYSQSSIEKFMEVVDTNGDGKCYSIARMYFYAARIAPRMHGTCAGYISFHEFHAAVLTQQERLLRSFRELDHGGDNRIGTRDLEKFALKMGLALSHDEIKKLVDAISRNGTGHIELSEFCEYFMTEVGDVHAQGLFETWLKAHPISAIQIPDAPQEEVPSWITLTSGATAGMVSRTLTAPADRLKTLLQAGDLQRRPSPLNAVASALPSSSRGWPSASQRLPQQASHATHMNRNYSQQPHSCNHIAGATSASRRPNTPQLAADGNRATVRPAGGGALNAITQATRRFAGPSQAYRSPALHLGMLPDEEWAANETAKARAPPSRSVLHVRNIRQGVKAIFADGGFAAFWRGNGINVLKVAPETATRFWAYERFKKIFCEDPDNITILERFLAGASAGAVSQATIYPLEVAKTRFALSTRGQYRSIGHCVSVCVQHEGPRALYRGMLASIVGIIPYSGVDLALYSLLKDTYEQRFPDREPGLLTLLCCGATATTCAQAVSYPLQLVRTRLQAQGMEGRPIAYNGILDCIAKTVRAEGLRGLYRGILPNFMVCFCMLRAAAFQRMRGTDPVVQKSVPAMAISYATYGMSSFHCCCNCTHKTVSLCAETVKRFLLVNFPASSQYAV